MTGMTPEEEKLAAELAASETLSRKERIEAERWEKEFKLKERELEHKKAENRRQLAGTIITAGLGLIGTLWGVGKKADPTVTNFFGAVYQGAVSTYKTVNPNYSVADAFPKAVPARVVAPAPAPVQQSIVPPSTPVLQAPVIPAPVAAVADGTCSGLDVQRWVIIPGAAVSFTRPNGQTGYTVRVNLKNQSQDVMSIVRTGGEMSDDQNHELNLSSGSMSPAGRPPTVVDPGVILPATFEYLGNGNNGSTVTFTANVATALPGKPFVNTAIGCTALPVHQIAK